MENCFFEPILIHIGVGKSGTTSLQENLFNILTNINNIGRPNHYSKLYKDFVYGITKAEDYELNDYVHPFLKYINNLDKSKKFVLSDENLLSEVDSIVAKRLKKFFPNASILISIRNQMTAIPSYYLRHYTSLKDVPCANKIKYISFDDYLKFFTNNSSIGFFKKINYYKQYLVYNEFFDEEKIHILLFEDMIYNQEIFFKKISSILDINKKVLFNTFNTKEVKNSNATSRINTYKKFRSLIPISSFSNIPCLNKIKPRINRFLKKGKSEKMEIPIQYIPTINLIFSKDNMKLAEKLNLDLRKYKYPLEEK